MFNKKDLIEMKATWKDLSIKEKLAITSACAAFVAGWVLTGIAAFVPLLLSEQSILWILGQSLTYSAAVFGVSAYFNAEAVKLKKDMNRHFRQMERLSIEREKLKRGDDVDLPDEDEDKDEE